MNTFGHILRLTTAGESHGPAMTAILDGFPAGIAIDRDMLNEYMKQRRPGGGNPGTSARREADRVEILSGVFEGISTGTPITLMIRNEDARSADYDALRDVYRPSHADYTYEAKYGIRDHRGGGRSSARETALRVAAGALADMALRPLGITVDARIDSIGGLKAASSECSENSEYSEAIEQLLERCLREGDTVGGVVRCVIRGVPAGLGEPVYGKLQAQLAAAMMSINAAHGFEYGMGFAGADRLGSEMLDTFIPDAQSRITTATNHSGGIQGGISNGRDITFRVAFKPIATMMRPMQTVDRSGRSVTIEPHGRHDVCAVPRAVPVVAAMARLVILDAILHNRTARL